MRGASSAAINEAKLYLALSGGVGGAKLALGLARTLAPEQLAVVANTGDDFEHLGLHIAPDLDTVMYTLAGLANTDTGWGRAGESWSFLEALEALGGETWFRLGDRDLALHVERTRRLRQGESLSAVTEAFCRKLGVRSPIFPMSDDPVRTMVLSGNEELSFQHYFVRERCRPSVRGFRFAGIEDAAPSPGLTAAIEDEALAAVVICPSNPFVSVDPILAVDGVASKLRASRAPVIAVSPIVGGVALKGPAAKMMEELNVPATAAAVARHYRDRGLVDGFVLDRADAAMAREIEEMGVATRITNTVMVTLKDREILAREVVLFAEGLAS